MDATMVLYFKTNILGVFRLFNENLHFPDTDI